MHNPGYWSCGPASASSSSSTRQESASRRESKKSGLGTGILILSPVFPFVSSLRIPSSASGATRSPIVGCGGIIDDDGDDGRRSWAAPSSSSSSSSARLHDRSNAIATYDSDLPPGTIMVRRSLGPACARRLRRATSTHSNSTSASKPGDESRSPLSKEVPARPRLRPMVRPVGMGVGVGGRRLGFQLPVAVATGRAPSGAVHEEEEEGI